MVHGLEDVLELDHVVVVAHLEDVNFASHLENVYGFHLFTWDNLDCDFFASLLVPRQFDLCRFALTELLAETVEVFDIWRVTRLKYLLKPLLLVLL